MSSEETRALVRAMESRVEYVGLGDMGDVLSMHIRALTQYSGQGRCMVVNCYKNIADRYREEVGSWTQRINWKMIKLGEYFNLHRDIYDDDNE